VAASGAHHDVDLSQALVLEPVPLDHWLVIAPVVWCLLFGTVLIGWRKNTKVQPMIALPALVGLVVIDALLLKMVWSEGPVTMVMGRWLPPFGIAFTVDILGAVFNLVAALTALGAGIYAIHDVDASSRRYGFYPFLVLMMVGVSGAFLTGDIFNLYVWFEVMLISSFGLLILGSEHAQIDGATKYGLLNLMGTTLFLVATGYLYAIFGTLNMADIAVKAEVLRGEAPLMTLAMLYLLAFGMKAAAFPVNFWLPASYHTPRIAVAGLFGGLLTKVGIYALIRSLIMLFPQEHMHLSALIGLVAVTTMIFGIMGALAQNDVRRLLGYVVISGIGVMLAGLAVATQAGISGTVLYALHSMIAMLALYLLAGVMRKLGGSYTLSELSGLYRQYPLLAAIALSLFFATAGLPPFSGFWPKVMLIKAALDVGQWWLAGSIMLVGFLTTIALGRVFALAWWRSPEGEAQRSEQAIALNISQLVPLVSLTVLVTWFGLMPESLVQIAQAAAGGILDTTAYIESVFPEGGLHP
jgi:multicomponent Na+:H+ antiporter subunit D